MRLNVVAIPDSQELVRVLLFCKMKCLTLNSRKKYIYNKVTVRHSYVDEMGGSGLGLCCFSAGKCKQDGTFIQEKDGLCS